MEFFVKLQLIRFFVFHDYKKKVRFFSLEMVKLPAMAVEKNYIPEVT